MFIFNKKGNALLITILVLVVLGILGMSHLTSMLTGIKQSENLFKGIDSNFLLEGLTNAAEFEIRRQANNYEKKPFWYNVFRTTKVKSSTSYIDIDLSGTKIMDLASKIADDIKIKARFYAKEEVIRIDSNGDKEEIGKGEEKFGQLEIIAQFKIDDNYYHSHAAKDVKVINPLFLSFDGDYNGINKYTMYIKYAYEEFSKKYGFNKEGGEVDDPSKESSVKNGNFTYNRLDDERPSGDGIEKPTNEQYFIRLDNGEKDNKGKVYLGRSKKNREDVHSAHKKIVIDIPRKGYGNFYNEKIDQLVHNMDAKHFSEDDQKNAVDKMEELWLRVTVKYKIDSKPKKKKKTAHHYIPVNIAKGSDYLILESMYSKYVLENMWQATKEKLIREYKKAYKNADGVDSVQSVTVYPGEKTIYEDDETKLNFLKKYMIIAGMIAKPEKDTTNPVISKSVTGFEHIIKPWYPILEEEGIVRVDKGTKEVMIPSTLNGGPTTKVGFYHWSSSYNLFLQLNRSYGSGDDYTHYYSGAHSTFVSDSVINNSYSGDDSGDSWRAQPTLQLHGAYKNGGFTSPTQVEGNVWARYVEAYFLKTYDKEGKSSYQNISSYEYDNIPIPNQTFNIIKNKGLYKTGNDTEEATLRYSVYDGPNIRAKYTKFLDPDPETQKKDRITSSTRRGINTRAIMVPYNKKDKPILQEDIETRKTIGEDPDYGNIYIDKVTSVFIDWVDFVHHNVKVEGNKAILYLNGIYLINSYLKFPFFEGIDHVEYVGKGAIIVAGDIMVGCDIVPQDYTHDMLILASIGTPNLKEGSIEESTILIKPEDNTSRLNIYASLVAMGRDVYNKAKRAHSGVPCAISVAFGANIIGNWVSDILFYYPTGYKDKNSGMIYPNEHLRGTFLKYDPRLGDDRKDNLENYIADIGRPFSYWKIWKNKDSEI